MADTPGGPDYTAITATLAAIAGGIASLRELHATGKAVPKLQETVLSLDKLQQEARKELEIIQIRISAADEIHDENMALFRDRLKKAEETTEKLRREFEEFKSHVLHARPALPQPQPSPPFGIEP